MKSINLYIFLFIFSLTSPFIKLEGRPRQTNIYAAESNSSNHNRNHTQRQRHSQPLLNNWESFQKWCIGIALGDAKAQEWSQEKINQKVIKTVNTKAKQRAAHRKKMREYQEKRDEEDRKRWAHHHPRRRKATL